MKESFDLLLRATGLALAIVGIVLGFLDLMPRVADGYHVEDRCSLTGGPCPGSGPQG